MSDVKDVNPEVETPEEASRRGFLQKVVAGAAGLVAGGEALAAEIKQQPVNTAALKISGPPSTPEEHAKDQKRLQAERLIQELGGNVQIQWVKGKLPAVRRVIQMEG